MGRKALFFDIDETLLDHHNYIPESTVRAIREARKNGHLAFLNSGRSRGYIQLPELLAIGFDGVVSACGTVIEYDGKVIFERMIPMDQAIRTVEICRAYNFLPILEGREYLYFDHADFGNDAYGRKLIGELGDRLQPLTENWGRWEINKLSLATPAGEGISWTSGREEKKQEELSEEALAIEARKAEGFRKLEEEGYDLLIHTPTVVEVVPHGFSKGTGIREVCELLDLDIADTFAFGDSVNDLGMFAVAGTAVCMGQGDARAKEAADYITTSLEEDGIWNALKAYGVI